MSTEHMSNETLCARCGETLGQHHCDTSACPAGLPDACGDCGGQGFYSLSDTPDVEHPCETCSGPEAPYGLPDMITMPPPAVSSVWNHPDGTAHSTEGPLGCYPCANLRRAALPKDARRARLALHKKRGPVGG